MCLYLSYAYSRVYVTIVYMLIHVIQWTCIIMYPCRNVRENKRMNNHLPLLRLCAEPGVGALPLCGVRLLHPFPNGDAAGLWLWL